MLRVMATASGPATGVEGAAWADSSTRMPVERTPVPAPSPCRNPRRENALLRFPFESSLGVFTGRPSFLEIFSMKSRVYQIGDEDQRRGPTVRPARLARLA